MLKFGLLTNPSKEITNEIRRIANLGFDFVEIGIEEPEATPQILLKRQKQILSLLKKNQMFALGHTAYWVQFGSSHEKVRRGWVEEGKEMIKTASSLKINFLNFHFAGRLGLVGSTESSREIFIKNFTSSMSELVRYAKNLNIVLMLENTPTDDPRERSIKDFSQIIEKIPSLKVHLDIAHAFIEGGMKRIKEYIDTFNKKIVHLHIHDNHGQFDEHLPLGYGLIDFERVAKWLKDSHYDKTITFEVFTPIPGIPIEKEQVQFREIFKKIWENV